MPRPKQIDPIAEALSLQKENRAVEFKEGFDPSATRDWCELLKDVMAIANSGGGVIVIGLDSNGKPSGRGISSVAALDPAKITDKLESYTRVQFDEFRLVKQVKNQQPVVCLEIMEAETPLIPTGAGTYQAPDGKKQERAFSAGVLLVRHGAKSEPANTWDLRKLIERRISGARKDVLQGVRRIARAPTGAKVDVLVSKRNVSAKKRVPSTGRWTPHEAQAVRASTAMDAAPVRLTTDPKAPAYHLVKPDQTHPLRMNDLVKKVNKDLTPLGQKISPHDIHSLNRVYGSFKNIEHCYESQHGPRQYSEDFASWIVDQCKKNPMFRFITRNQSRRLKRYGLHEK
jgi:hypothetical protein